ncbi:hypothetical protein [Dactylosporangium cerinum]
MADVDAAGGQVGAPAGVADGGPDRPVREAGQQLFDDEPAEGAGCAGDNDHGGMQHPFAPVAPAIYQTSAVAFA